MPESAFRCRNRLLLSKINYTELFTNNRVVSTENSRHMLFPKLRNSNSGS